MNRGLVRTLLIVLALGATVRAADPAGRSAWVWVNEQGRLSYRADEQGNTIPDFSHCGYAGGEKAIPDVPTRLTLQPTPAGDDTARIQQAIDDVSKLPAADDGFRGAVLLARGNYRVDGTLAIRAGGVVLRGEGDDDAGTVVRATGPTTRPLVRIGAGGPVERIAASRVAVTDDYVPVGARTMRVSDASGFAVGDGVVVARAGNAEWISAIGMDRIPPRANPGEPVRQWTPFELRFDRVITAIDGNAITVDAPIACAIEQRWGGGSVTKVRDARISDAGVEDLLAISDFDPSITATHDGRPYASDERHAEYLVHFEDVKNAWTRRVTARHFAHGVALIGRNAKWVSVVDAKSLEPVSEIRGGRRYPFHVLGQLALVQRCFSDGARHAFVFSSQVCGPNAFVRCRSQRDYSTSEPHHRWSVGGLYDNVEARLAIQDRGNLGTGHGWAGANYVVWNSRGSLVLQRPPTANNWAIGFVGERAAPFFEGRDEGTWDSFGVPVVPVSLFESQRAERAPRR
jgi:hypothetical protein